MTGYRKSICYLMVRSVCFAAMVGFVCQVSGKGGKGKEQESQPSIENLMREGGQQIAAGDTEAAIKTYKSILKRDKNQDAAWHMLGYALHMSGDLDEAIKAHGEAAKSSNQQISNLGNYNLACAYSIKGKIDKAIRHLKTIASNGYRGYQQMRDDPDLHNLAADQRFARILYQVNGDEYAAENIKKAEKKIENGDFDQAAEIYKTLLEDDDTNPFLTYRLGYSLHGDGKLDEALEYHKKAAGYPGTKGVGTYNVGCVYALKGEKDQAFEAFEAAIDLGFAQAKAFEEDSDLKDLREEDRFAKLVEKAKAKAEEQEKSGT